MSKTLAALFLGAVLVALVAMMTPWGSAVRSGSIGGRADFSHPYWPPLPTEAQP